jgi:hypothetical protein
MAALTAERNTPRLGDEGAVTAILKLPMKASTKIYKGSLVVIDAGYAAPGRTATGLIAVGRAERTVDNSSGAAGALFIEVRRGCHGFANSAAGDLIAQANVGAIVYIVDDQTVALTSATNTRSVAGQVLSIGEGDSLVYVETTGRVAA